MPADVEESSVALEIFGVYLVAAVLGVESLESCEIVLGRKNQQLVYVDHSLCFCVTQCVLYLFSTSFRLMAASEDYSPAFKLPFPFFSRFTVVWKVVLTDCVVRFELRHFSMSQLSSPIFKHFS